MNINKQLRIYNLINITSIITLTTVQIAVYTIWYDQLDYWINFSDDEAFVLTLIPVMFLILILNISTRIMKSLIHYYNQILYEANNINIDDYVDEGTIPESALAALPSSSKEDVCRRVLADKAYYGELDDLDLVYEVNKFAMVINYGQKKQQSIAYQLRGQALITKTANYNFGPDWTMFVNQHVKIKDPVYVQPNVEPIECDEIVGNIYYEDSLSSKNLLLIKQLILNHPAIFADDSDLIGLFKDEHFILITEERAVTRFRVPFVIRKAKFNQIISEQKAEVYRFNQLLVEISRLLSGGQNETKENE